MAKKRSLLSEAGSSSAGEGRKASVAALASVDSGEESAARGDAVSSSSSKNSVQASAGSGGWKL